MKNRFVPKPMDIKALSFLQGVWKGSGTAIYPTIDSTKYFDEIEFDLDETAGVIYYRQKTWYDINGVKGSTLHMESGYIRMSDYRCELSNSQSNGRTEVMQLLFFAGGNIKRLYFVSSSFSNDSRIVKTRRDIMVEGNKLTYEMKMATSSNIDIRTHLFSTLTKAA